jgi:hypothetical protein
LGFAILGQKQYTSALVRYWASVRAEVFQCSPYICVGILIFIFSTSIGQRFRAEEFQIRHIANPIVEQNPVRHGGSIDPQTQLALQNVGAS